MSQGFTKNLTEAQVSDATNSFPDGDIQPLSLTSEGRLRVSSVQSDLEKAWEGIFADPWQQDTGYGFDMGAMNYYV